MLKAETKGEQKKEKEKKKEEAEASLANNGGVWRVSLIEAIARWSKPGKGGKRETARPFFFS